MEALPLYLTDEVIFDSISAYFDIVDLLHLSQVSRALNAIIQERIKRMIKEHNLPLVLSKKSIHQLKFYFDRCLTLYKKKEDSQEIKAEKVSKEKAKQEKYNSNDKPSSYSLMSTIQNPFKFKTIVYFEVGVQYTVFLTVDKEAYLIKTCSLINFKDKKLQLNYEKRSNVAQIKCKGEHITYLTQSGEVYQIFGQKNSQKLFEREELIEWCQYIQVEKIQASFNYTLFKPRRNNVSYEEFLKYVFHYQIDIQKFNTSPSNSPQKTNDHYESLDQNTTLVLLNNISFKHYLIEFEKYQKIIQFVVGSRQAYFLNENYECFVCYFQQEGLQNGGMQNLNTQNNKILKAKRFHHFIQKQIIKLASGYNFFIALERKIHDVSKWTVEEVCKWVRDIGFGPFAKIFSVQKVDGKKLLTIDKNYMHSSLGITKLNMQQKLLMLLAQVIENKNKQDTLYGWGKNQNGQLCSRNANFIKQPQRIKLPNCFKQSEYIDSIFCGWFETFIRTQKGRVYRTINYQKKRKTNLNPNQQDEIELKINDKTGKYLNEGKKGNVDYEQAYDSQTEFEQKKNSGKNDKAYNSKKKRKYTQDLAKKDNHHKKFEEEQRWIECQVGKAFFVQGYKDILFFIQCPSQKLFEPAKEKKLRTIKMVMNKIIWSQGAEEQQLYKVGYLDKDMGLIETTILELKSFDYNENRIKYIKKTNQIVWDRQNKIDNVG